MVSAWRDVGGRPGEPNPFSVPNLGDHMTVMSRGTIPLYYESLYGYVNLKHFWGSFRPEGTVA